MTGTTGLATLVARGLVAPDWAEALAPVDGQITAMGEFLRAEVRAGRTYLPHGDHVLRAFSRPLADVKVLVVGQDPYPTPGHAGRPVVLGRPGRAAAAEEPGQHLQGAASTTSAARRPRPATSPRGSSRA